MIATVQALLACLPFLVAVSAHATLHAEELGDCVLCMLCMLLREASKADCTPNHADECMDRFIAALIRRGWVRYDPTTRRLKTDDARALLLRINDLVEDQTRKPLPCFGAMTLSTTCSCGWQRRHSEPFVEVPVTGQGPG